MPGSGFKTILLSNKVGTFHIPFLSKALDLTCNLNNLKWPHLTKWDLTEHQSNRLCTSRFRTSPKQHIWKTRCDQRYSYSTISSWLSSLNNPLTAMVKLLSTREENKEREFEEWAIKHIYCLRLSLPVGLLGDNTESRKNTAACVIIVYSCVS